MAAMAMSARIGRRRTRHSANRDNQTHERDECNALKFAMVHVAFHFTNDGNSG